MPAGTRLLLAWPRLARTRTRAGVGGGWAATARAATARASIASRHGTAVEPAAWEQRQNAGEEQARRRPDDGAETGPKRAAAAAAAAGSAAAAKEAGEPASDATQGHLLAEVLHMPAPDGDASPQPQMAPPPYVHHFDSYSLVKQLQAGGYTPAQATTAMKAIRTLLAQNLDVAQRSLVGKSDVENESYLFTAACAELSAEIKNNRRLQDEHTRQQRTLLQHEVDILAQTLNQELLTLNDNVRGMFNDRKMAVREEQKAVESAIQKIHYKMSILLSSDCKSEIEGVRWILIRRSVLGIIFLAMVTLGMLRYAAYAAQQRKHEADRRRRELDELRRDGGKTDHSAAADAAAILAAN